MENHPIPQDITGFQFKLIGNMTVKQFIYLAAGTVIAWFVFFILPLHIIIRFPIAAIFLGLGVSFAFVPVDGRPMDTMVANLIRALFAPTQYIYKKNGGNISDQIHLQHTAQTQTTTPPQQAAQDQIIPQEPVLQMATASPMPMNPQTTPAPLMSLDDEEDKQKAKEEEKIEENESPFAKATEDKEKLEDEVAVLKKELEIAKSTEKIAQLPPELPAVDQKAAELEKLLGETTRQKEALEKEFLILRAKLDGQQQEKFSPTDTPAPLKQTQRVRNVPAGMEKSVGLPAAPQDPNLIVGIVKDPRGNPLPNILVEVKDTEDSPVRAFKTNGLGQFASATSLSNGKYIIIFEDPGGKNKFDAVQIEAIGAPIMPLEIFSVDPREELRRELFN